jgi:hypothetical protein
MLFMSLELPRHRPQIQGVMREARAMVVKTLKLVNFPQVCGYSTPDVVTTSSVRVEPRVFPVSTSTG